MSDLDIFLSVALALVIALLFRMYRKQLILRHLFIQSSDWCARKIDEMVESASYAVMESEMARAAESGRMVPEDRARDAIPYVILNAKKEWLEQKDTYQARLRRNGISPLDIDDLDNLIIQPGLAGFK